MEAVLTGTANVIVTDQYEILIINYIPEGQKEFADKQYEEYLKMLVLLQNEQKKYYRTMSAMEIRMIELGNTDFRLKNYIYGAQSRAAFKIGTLPHSYEKTCSYHYG